MLAIFRSSCTYEYFIHDLNQERLYFYQNIMKKTFGAERLMGG